MSGTTFCSATTIESSLNILTDELNFLGFPKIVDRESDTVLIVKLVNVLWSVVQAQKRKIQKMSKLNELILKLQSEIKWSVQKIKQLEVNSNNLSKEDNKTKIALNKIMSERDSTLKEIKEIKTENIKLNSVLVSQKSLQEHELRKRDDLIQNLQSQLLKVVESDLKSNVPAYMKMATASCKDNKCLHESLLNQCICQLDMNIQTLLVENADVRCALLKLYTEIISLDKLSAETSSEEYLPEHLFQLPYVELLGKIESSAVTLISNIKSQISCLNDK